MDKVLRTTIVFVIVLSFLIPVTNTAIGETDEGKDIKEEPNNISVYSNSETYLAKNNDAIRNGELPQLEAYRQNKKRSRADHDIGIDLDQTPTFRDLSDATWQVLYADNQDNLIYFWGASGEVITYSPVVVNYGAVDIASFKLRMAITPLVWDQANTRWAWEGQNDLINTTTTLGPLPAGQNSTEANLDARLSWEPLAGMRVRAVLSVEYNQDTNAENNRFNWFPYILSDYNTLETAPEQNGWTKGAGWSVYNLPANDDANPAHHSAPTVLKATATSTGYAEYAMDFSKTLNNVIPWYYGGMDNPTQKGAYIGLQFSSDVALSTWAFEVYNTSSNSWQGDIEGSQKVNDGWYSYRHMDDQQNPTYSYYYTYMLDKNETGAGAKFRAKGQKLFLDDFWISSIETPSARGAEPPIPEKLIPNFSFDLIPKEGEGYLDNSGNGILDQEFSPGNEYSWNFTVINTATNAKDPYHGHALGASINKVEFTVTKPDDWDVTLQNIVKEIGPGTQENFTLTVKIPEDAKASIAYQTDDDDWNPYIISFDAVATPKLTDPAPIPLEAYVNNTEIETLVTAYVGIDVEIDDDSLNQTGVQGGSLDYVITIENTGNSNLTEELKIDGNKENAEVVIEVDKMRTQSGELPKQQWDVRLDVQNLEIEYGETEEVKVTINIPANSYSGYFETDVTISIEDFDIEETKTLTAGVEQIYGLELDFKVRTDNKQEVDPNNKDDPVEVPIVFEVVNKGNGPEKAVFEVTADDKEDKDWFDLGDEDFVLLDPVAGLHDERPFTVLFTVPLDVTAGEHKFSVMAVSDKDPLAETETEEKEIVFTILRPDLVVSTDIKLDPAMPVMGKETEIGVRIFNNGTAGATSFSVSLYIDEDFVDYQNVNILMKNQLNDLPPFVYVFEENRPYDIKVVVDPIQKVGNIGNVTEIDELNNEALRITEVIAPDLKFKTDITVSTDEGLETLEPNLEDLFEGKKDDEFTVTFTVENDGDADAKKVKVNLKVVYYDAFDDEIKEYEDNSTPVDIKAGKSTTVDFNWAPLQYATQYTVIVTIDQNGEIPESNENNNKLEKMLLETPKPPKKDDPSPGFEVFLAIAVLLGVCIVMYRKRR